MTDLATFEEVTYIHGCKFVVVKNADIRYLSAKELVDYAGMNWKRARNTLTAGDNVIRFGSKMLIVPKLGEKTALNSTKKDLFLRADRAHFFMARIRTDTMRSAGKEEEADFLLNKQLEWANALFAYENGQNIVGKNTDIKTLLSLISSQDKVNDAGQKNALNRMINDMLVASGYPPTDPQGKLI